MQRLLLIISLTLFFSSCKDKTEEKNFTVTGILRNGNAKMIYLEKVPAATMQPTLEDSAAIGKDGKFSLGSEAIESTVFNLRIDQNEFPLLSVINDTNTVKLDISLSTENGQFPEKYEVSGSIASQSWKEFATHFNNELIKIYKLHQQADSLKKAGSSDSILAGLLAEPRLTADNLKDYSMKAIEKANDPALAIFELGYYQSMSNTSGYGLSGFDSEQVTEVVNRIATRFPGHQAVAAIKASLDQQRQKAAMANMVGKEAPDFTMPDVNGKPVSLSSFRGKYVLVDFWASWCGPCRQENPNVVNAYKEFKGKNFTILGVSLDQPGQKDKWVKAIMDDKLTWTNVSDLQHWNSPVIPLYGIDGIPFNVLIDPSGKVIAQALRGQELINTLSQLLIK